MNIRAIITGATGMVGESVLHECLLHPEVEQVLVINRRPCGVSHPKLKEIIHNNFQDLKPIEDHLYPYNACYFNWMYPVLRPLFPGFVSTLSEVGLAMINTVIKGFEKQVLEVKDIVALSRR